MAKKKEHPLKGKQVSPETRQKMIDAQQKRMKEGRHNFHIGHTLSVESRAKLSASLKGRMSPRKGMSNSVEHITKAAEGHRLKWQDPAYQERQRLSHLGKPQAPETVAKRVASRKGYRHSEETRRKMSESQRARRELHHMWKGGITPTNKIIRRSLEFKLWREAVFARDNWTCQHCGKRGGELHPDHIKPFAQYPDLRFDVDNGRTLCKECHQKTDTWGAGPKKNSVSET